MAYEYYRGAAPGWGTSQYQMGTPPLPGFHPEPTWGAMDYYRANTLNPDPSMMSSIWDRVRGVSVPGSYRSREARHIHRQIYSGLISPNRALPSEIGSAAAYEAYRTWKYHSSAFLPPGVQSENVREGLVGTAAAEASRLWQISGRGMDTYGLRDALETAAVTASHLYYRRLADNAGMVGGAQSMQPSLGAPGVAGGGATSSVLARDFAYPPPRSLSVPPVMGAGSSIVPSPYIGGSPLPGVSAGLAGVGTGLGGGQGLPLENDMSMRSAMMPQTGLQGQTALSATQAPLVIQQQPSAAYSQGGMYNQGMGGAESMYSNPYQPFHHRGKYHQSGGSVFSSLFGHPEYGSYPGSYGQGSGYGGGQGYGNGGGQSYGYGGGQGYGYGGGQGYGYGYGGGYGANASQPTVYEIPSRRRRRHRHGHGHHHHHRSRSSDGRYW